jgi:hypothetical protein
MCTDPSRYSVGPSISAVCRVMERRTDDEPVEDGEGSVFAILGVCDGSEEFGAHTPILWGILSSRVSFTRCTNWSAYPFASIPVAPASLSRCTKPAASKRSLRASSTTFLNFSARTRIVSRSSSSEIVARTRGGWEHQDPVSDLSSNET